MNLVQSSIGYRPAARALHILRGLLPGGQAPSANGGQGWFLRLGLYELQRPKEQADDWVWMIDHTIQTGNGKCFLVVGVRLSVWEAKRWAVLAQDPQAAFALEHQDLSLFDLDLMESSNGRVVQERLEQIAQTTGITPCAILCDQGPDVRPGAVRFHQASDRPVVVIHDIAHGVANALKRQLSHHAQWEPFLADANRSKTQIRQTAYAFLMPPELKNKARWMNLQPLIDWSCRVQQFLHDPTAVLDQAETPLDLETLEQKMGWLRGYAEALDGWSLLLQAAGITLQYIRRHGYHARAPQELASLLAGLTEGPAAAMVAQVLEFVATQSRLCHERSLPGSTEVLESLIGKGKQQMGRNKNGYTKSVLAMAAAVVTVTADTVKAALENVTVSDLSHWITQHLGLSLAAQRQRLLHPGTGTKTA